MINLNNKLAILTRGFKTSARLQSVRTASSKGSRIDFGKWFLLLVPATTAGLFKLLVIKVYI